jgi:uncharacterized OB-fold protein
MSDPAEGLIVSRCESCHGRFVPREGSCPFCGSSEITPQTIPPRGFVLASTELLAPAAGWNAPHRLALVAAAEDVRILALVDGPLPEPGSIVGLEHRDGRYRARTVDEADPKG